MQLNTWSQGLRNRSYKQREGIEKMPTLICNPFRGRSSRFWGILLISFHLLFDLIVVLLYSRSPARHVGVEKTIIPTVNPINLCTALNIHNKPAQKMNAIINDQELTTRKPILFKTTRKPASKKPVIDMVNDYQPWIDFKFVYPDVQPIILGPRNFYVVVLVNSGAKGDEFRQRRKKIRETWASKKTCEHANAMNNSTLKDLKWVLVFVLGKAGVDFEDETNIEEARLHNDMIIGDINDNYLNNILKFYMGQLWASMLGTKYTLKTDDDVYVRIPKIIEYLVSEGSPPRFYGGETYPNTLVARWPNGKWSISKKYFDEPKFPPFNAGAFIIMSTDLLGSLFNYVYIRKPFHTDDAYVGVAMRDFKVKVVHILSFDIKNNMATLILTKSNCDILKLIAYGHTVHPAAMQHLHGRVEDLCHKAITLKNCK